MKTIKSTPRRDGFRMPGEFEPHTGCWMLWPQRTDFWPYGAKLAQRAYAAVAIAISRFEKVTMGTPDCQYLTARAMLPPEIRVVEISYDGEWIRDTGPTFVVNGRGEVCGIDWQFNAWGGLDGGQYFPWNKDNLVTRKILEMENIDRYKADLILEGGAIHVDGDGTLLATEECLSNPNRNPNMGRGDVENALMDYLNIEKVIWLKKGLEGDPTGGHIDNLCCFIRPGVVALNWTDDRSDPQFEICHDAYERLGHVIDAKGRSLEVHRIHQPDPIYLTKEDLEGRDVVEGSLSQKEGENLAATYINFYIANQGVIVPQFDDPRDKAAVDVLQGVFPSRRIVGVPARVLLLGGGNIHCITQQQPRGL